MRARVVVLLVVLIAAAFAASVLVTQQFLLARMDERIDRRIAAQVTELRNLARTGVDPATGRPFTQASSLMRLALERTVPDRNETLFSIVGGQPSARSAQQPLARLDTDRALVTRLGEITRPQFGIANSDRGEVRYAAVPVTVGRTRGVYVVAWFRDADAGEVRSTVGLLALVGTVAAAVAALLAWLFTGRVLRPLHRLAAVARQVDARDLDGRVPVRGHDELSDIARTVNGMLDRLQHAFETQRRFADDAGHELRTPITIVRGHLELLAEQPERRAAQRELMLDELDRMSRMVEELLTLSRSDQADFARADEVDVDVLAGEFEAKVVALGDRRWSFDTTAVGRVVVDRQLVTQAVLQLAQNAVQHTSTGDAVTLGTRLADGTLRIWVHDSGPGLPAGHREQVFARFARGRDARRAGPGAGLGLAIVRAIAAAHGGTARFEEPPDGRGALVVLEVPSGAALPPAPPSTSDPTGAG